MILIFMNSGGIDICYVLFVCNVLDKLYGEFFFVFGLFINNKK